MNIKVYTKNWNRLRSIKEIIINIYYSIVKKDIILILNIGKVGSTSVYKTLKKHTKKHCFHIHRISEKGLKKQIDFHIKYDNHIPPHIIVARFFRNRILNYNKKIDLVVIVRNPIDRFLSYIFQHHNRFKIQPFLTTDSENYNNTINLITERILEEKAWNEFDEWFEEEVYETFGIDIYNQQYNEEKGYNLYTKGNTTLLLLKMENLNKEFSIVSKILFDSEKEIKLEPHNIGEEKEYKEEYRLVKKHIKFEKGIIENFIDSKYFQHFYAGQENEMIKKWSK